MRDAENDAPKLTPPKTNRKAELCRAAASTATCAIPVVGSAAAELANEILPDPSAERRWFVG